MPEKVVSGIGPGHTIKEAHLVMDVMIWGVVSKYHLEGIKRQGVTAMVIDGFEGGKGKEEDALSDAHP